MAEMILRSRCALRLQDDVLLDEYSGCGWAQPQEKRRWRMYDWSSCV